MKGEAVVDGVLDDPDWARAVPIVRSQAWRDDGLVTIRIMYSKAGLYVSAEVADRNLWADGIGAGRGSRWGIQNDDSFTFYVDPDESRDEFLQPGDRAFGVNLGNPRGPHPRPGARAAVQVHPRRWHALRGRPRGVRSSKGLPRSDGYPLGHDASTAR